MDIIGSIVVVILTGLAVAFAVACYREAARQSRARGSSFWGEINAEVAEAKRKRDAEREAAGAKPPTWAETKAKAKADLQGRRRPE